MDQVKLTHFQLRTLAKADENVVITATNEDAGMILVEPLAKQGEGKAKWMHPNGKYRTSAAN